MSRTFKIYGSIVPKARPRHNTKTGVTYTPAKTKKYEKKIVESYNAKYEGIKYPKDVPLKVGIVAYFEIPKSDTAKKMAEKRANRIMPTKRPDLDNIAKTICDGLNEVAYYDDCQIVEMTIEKRYSDEPRVEVTIEQKY